jgi:hypothetical protein
MERATESNHFFGFPTEGPIHRSGMEERPVEGEESIRDKGKLPEHLFTHLGC